MHWRECGDYRIVAEHGDTEAIDMVAVPCDYYSHRNYSSSQTPLLRFVVDLLYSLTFTSPIHDVDLPLNQDLKINFALMLRYKSFI